MRGRSTERTSILLLGRNTVIFGAVLVTIISFGLGYFFGYKGTDTGETEKDTKEEVVTKTNQAPPPGEKKVLEASPAKDAPEASSGTPQPTQAASAPIVPPAPAKSDAIKPPAPIPEVAPQKQPGRAAKTPERDTPGPQDHDKINKDNERGDAKAAEGKGVAAGKSAKKKKVAAGSSPQKKKKAAVKSKEHKIPAQSAKKEAQRAESAKTAYTVQLGAFPTKEGAEQLRKSLEAKGYKPYITDAREGDPYYRVRVGSYASKKDAEHGAGELSKQTGLQNFVTTK